MTIHRHSRVVVNARIGEPAFDVQRTSRQPEAAKLAGSRVNVSVRVASLTGPGCQSIAMLWMTLL